MQSPKLFLSCISPSNELISDTVFTYEQAQNNTYSDTHDAKVYYVLVSTTYTINRHNPTSVIYNVKTTDLRCKGTLKECMEYMKEYGTSHNEIPDCATMYY